MGEDKVGLSAPWYEYQRKLKAFFEFDPDVEVDEVDEDENGVVHIGIIVKKHEKFEALNDILVLQLSFGGTVVLIDLYDAENRSLPAPADYAVAFKDNPVFQKLFKATVQGNTFYFFALDNEPVEFFNDDISDYRGNYHGFYADIAKEIFYAPVGIKFCTIAKQDK